MHDNDSNGFMAGGFMPRGQYNQPEKAGVPIPEVDSLFQEESSAEDTFNMELLNHIEELTAELRVMEDKYTIARTDAILAFIRSFAAHREELSEVIGDSTIHQYFKDQFDFEFRI